MNVFPKSLNIGIRLGQAGKLEEIQYETQFKGLEKETQDAMEMAKETNET